MRVSLDARLLGAPGIGRFIVGLWEGLIDLGVDLSALSTARPRREWLGPARFDAVGPTLPVRGRPFGLAEQVALPTLLRRRRIEVHHSPHLTVPYLTRVPVVLTVHDLFPYREPSNARSRPAALYYRAAFPRALRKASAVVAVSPSVVDEICALVPVSEDRVHVIEHGIDHRRWRPSPESVARVLAILDVPRPYLLYVGTAMRRKNLPTLVRAHDDNLPPLVLAGPSADELRAAAPGADIDGRLLALGRVSDEELSALYAGATALVLPSFYEAVGFTALEAMASGTPVVSSDDGEGLTHTVGEAGILVPPTEVDAWRAAMHRIVDDGDLRTSLAAAGRARVAGRSWRAAAEQYIKVYESVL